MYNNFRKELIDMAYTEALKNATIKYKKEHLKRIPLEVRLDQYEKIKAYAEKNNKPINTALKEIIFEKISI